MLTDPDGCWFFPPCGARRDGGVDRVTDRKVDSDGSIVTVFNVTVFLTGKETFLQIKFWLFYIQCYFIKKWNVIFCKDSKKKTCTFGG